MVFFLFSNGGGGGARYTRIIINKNRRCCFTVAVVGLILAERRKAACWRYAEYIYIYIDCCREIQEKWAMIDSRIDRVVFLPSFRDVLFRLPLAPCWWMRVVPALPASSFWSPAATYNGWWCLDPRDKIGWTRPSCTSRRRTAKEPWIHLKTKNR